MRIGIDASRAFGSQKTGTENYSWQILRHMLEMSEAKKHTWILYTRGEVVEPWLNEPHIKVSQVRLPALWTQVGLAARTWIDNIDVLWVPAHTLPLLRKPGVRTVVTIHGIEYEFLPAYENILQRWYLPLSTRYAVASANQIIAVSQFTRGQLVERLQANNKKITVIYEGVEAKTIKNDRSKALQTLSALKLEPQKYILFIGTVQPRKNLDNFIAAFKKAGLNDVKLVIVGKLGWGYELLPIDTDDQILFLRYTSDADRDTLLASALLYVQPSITEGFGLPVLEAYSAGVPVISSFGGALKEVAGLDGLDNLFDPYDVDSMAKMINRGVTDSLWQKKLISAGVKKLQQFSWQKAARETYNIIVLGNNNV